MSPCASVTLISPLQPSLLDQVGMASSLSFTSSSSSVPSLWVEGCHPCGPVGGQSEPSSLSSSILTRSDAKAIKAVEIMKSCHDFNSTLSVELLALIQKLYSISDKYALSAPLLRQRSYHEYPRGFASLLKP
ncbi:hypothetical protein BHM03_00054675 [Ensete ventricosum]|nr:hypothetical protein BHM03_00054675 [Ensete ventricosum]